MAGGYMTLTEALDYARMAEADLADQAHEIPTAPVLRLVDETSHAAYDCEYGVLARELGCRLVTGDPGALPGEGQ